MIEMTINKADFDKLLKKLDSGTQDEVIRKSLTESAQYLAGWIRTRRLMGPRPQFLGRGKGDLIRSVIATDTIKVGNSYIAKIGSNIQSKGFYYGAYWEGVAPFDGVRRTPPRPFMRPAIEDRENIEGVVEDLRSNLEKALEK